MTSLCCPKCKESLVVKTQGYLCHKCGNFYPLCDGYIDFLGDVEFYAGEASQKDMQTLISDIDSFGYHKGLKFLYERYPYLKGYVEDIRRADWICHCIGRNNLRCLDIGSGLGNLSEMLSYAYQEAYSLEAVKERIEFQKRRYKNSNRSNITIIRGNALELPFPDNYFDMVVCNGVLEWIGTMNKTLPPREAQLSFLREARRVLSRQGCLYIGIENRFGLWFLLGAKDHSGLRYTTLLPRTLASIMVKRYGYSGGIYGDKSKKVKEERGYYTYTYSIWGYNSILKQAGFKFKSYWVFPSYNQPYMSGRLDDKIGLKGYTHYFKNSITRFKFTLSILEKFPKSILGLFANLFSPSFLFYCYKDEIGESLDDIITNNSQLENYTTLSGGHKIMYILYDKNGKPSKVAHSKRYKYELPISIPFHEKTHPINGDQLERIWLEDWIHGKKLDPLNVDEARLAIDWLINFQNETRSTNMTQNDISSEVSNVRVGLIQVPEFNTARNLRWLDDYESYLRTVTVAKTSEHGDFWYGNILIDPITHKMSVIDWEYFREKGDPFYDFVFFIIDAMQLPNNSAEDFRSNLKGSGKFNSILNILQDSINSHFGFEMNLKIIIAYALLRFVVTKASERKLYDKTIINYDIMLKNYQKLLDVLAEEISFVSSSSN